MDFSLVFREILLSHAQWDERKREVGDPGGSGPICGLPADRNGQFEHHSVVV